MERIVERTLLYDFYGELLTRHQREVYEDVVLGDLGYSEAAQDYGVSRQGIHDLIKRVDRQLDQFEERLHLVERFLSLKQEVTRIQTIAGKGALSERESESIRKLCTHILNEL